MSFPVSLHKKNQWDQITRDVKDSLIIKPKCHPLERPITRVGGLDISFIIGDKLNACAAYVVTQSGTQRVLYKETKLIKLEAPYIPGYLAFREASPLINLVKRQILLKPELTPHAILVDGNGILHQDRCGVACHIGVSLNITTIGVAKTLFQVPKDKIFNNEQHRNSVSNLKYKGIHIMYSSQDRAPLACAVRTDRNLTEPVYVSVGHNIGLKSSVELVTKNCFSRIVEPIRLADFYSRDYLRTKVVRKGDELVVIAKSEIPLRELQNGAGENNCDKNDRGQRKNNGKKNRKR